MLVCHSEKKYLMFMRMLIFCLFYRLRLVWTDTKTWSYLNMLQNLKTILMGKEIVNTVKPVSTSGEHFVKFDRCPVHLGKI